MIDIAFGLGFVAGSVTLALAAYLMARAVAAPRMTEDTKALADSMVFRIGALHGLILALVFAQELLAYREIRLGLAIEATAVSDLYFDIARYAPAPEIAAAVRAALEDYVRIAVGPEWESLAATDRLLQSAWEAREIVYGAVLDLVPETPRQETLRAKMLADIHTLAQLRDAREVAALSAISPMFWVAAFAGVLLVVLPYFRFAPTALNMVLLASFAAYAGLVLSFIYAFADPFAAPGRLEPAALERLLRTGMGVGA